MIGACCFRPVPKHLVPSWDLSIVLEAISQLAFFELLECVEMKHLSILRRSAGHPYIHKVSE